MSNPVLELGDQLAAAKASSEEIIARTRREARGFTGDERRKLDANEREITRLRGEIERMALTGERGNPNANAIGLSDREIRGYSLTRAIRAMVEGRLEQDAPLEYEASVAAAHKLGKTVRGLMLPADLVETRTTGGATQLVGTTGIGGYLVQTDVMGSSLIDSLKNRLVVAQLGATTMTGLVGNVAIPRVTSDPTTYWVAEDTDVTLSNAAFDQLTLSPKTLGGAVAISRRLLLQSSVDVERFIRTELVNTLAVEIDRVALAGTGGTQPYGIAATTGVNAQAMSATTNANTAPTWATLLGFLSQISADNADVGSLGWAINPATRAYCMATPKTTTISAGFLMEGDGRIAGFPAVVSNQVRSTLNVKAPNASEIFFGAFGQLVVGMWSGIELLTDPYTQALSGTVRVRALVDLDIGLRHPAAFCYSSDVATS